MPVVQPIPSPTPPTGPIGGPPDWPRDADGSIAQRFWNAMPRDQWIEVPGTKLRQVAPPFRLLGVEGYAAIIDDWCGASHDTRRSRLLFQCGGHQGYVGNEIVALNFRSMTVERIWGPDAPSAFWTLAPGQDEFSKDPSTGLALSRNNNPTGVHTYRSPAYIPEIDATARMSLTHGPVVFRHDINDWDRSYPEPASRDWKPGEGIPYTYNSRAMAWQGRYYAFTEEFHVYVWDPARNVKKRNGTEAFGLVERFALRHPIGPHATSIERHATAEFFHFSTNGGPYPEIVVTRLDRAGSNDFSRVAKLEGERSLVSSKHFAAAGGAWIAELNRFLVLENRDDGQPNRLLEVRQEGDRFIAAWHPTTGTAPGYSINGVFSRLQAVRFGPVVVLVVVTHVDQNARLIRIA